MKNRYFKAIALLSALFVAGAVFVTYRGYNEALEVTKTHFGNHHLLMARQTSIGIEKNIHALIKLLSTLSKEKAIRDMDTEKSRILLEKVYEHAREHSVNDVALMDAAGIIRLALNAPYLEGEDFSFREYYLKAKELKTSAPVYEHVEFKGVDTGKKGIVIAVPVFSGEKRFGGLVLFTVKVEKLLGDLLSSQTYNDKAWVIDSGGNILYHPDYPPGTNIAELADSSESFRAFVADIMSADHRHSEYISPEGIATTAACYPVTVAGETWEIIVSAPVEEFTSIVSQSSQKYGIGIFLLVVASTIIALTLRAYNSTLKRNRDELETRVKERTADLAAAEGELRSIYNSITGYLTVISPDYRILSYNETVEKQFGEGLKGRLCYEAYQARDAVCPDCAVKKTLETKKPAYTYQPATSLSKSVEIYTYPIFDDKGNVSAVVEHGSEIAERTELEENYHRQRVLMNTVFETTPDVMYIKDKEGKYVVVNGAFEKMMDVSCDEATGKTMEEIFPGEFAAESHASDLRVLEGENYHKEQRVVKDGKTIIFDTIKMPLRDKDGAIYGIVGISRDITERKEAEDEIKEINARLQTLIDSIPGMVFFKDAGGRHLVVNRTCAEMIGLQEKEIIGKTVHDFFPADLAVHCSRGDEEVARAGETVRTEEDVGDGKILETIKAPIVDDRGNYAGMVGLAFDVTERRRAEESLQRLMKAVESLTVGVTISDVEGKIIYTNPAEAEMHGYEVEELIGIDVNSLAPQEIWKDIELKERGSAFTRESMNVRKDGSVFPVHLTSVGVEGEDGAPFTIITVCEDITERKLAEEALRGSEERYRALIENIAVGIAVISPRMEILSVNSKMQEWFPDIDASKRPTCYRSFNQPPRDDVCSYCPITKTLEDGEVHVAITDTPAGEEIRHYKIVASPLRNENGEIIAAIEMCEDITERQRAEEELKATKGIAEEERAKTEAIIACIGDGISIHDRDFRIVYQNEAHMGMIGRHVGEYCYRAYQGKDHICEGCPLAKAFEDGDIHQAERSGVFNGSLLHVSITSSPLRDVEGNIIAGIEVVRNITERKRAEEELAYNQLFLKSIIENEPECVKLVDSEGTLIDMNASGLRMIDAESLEQVRGKNVYGLVAPEHREMFKAHVEKVCKGEKSMMEFRAIGLKGRSIWLETHAVPFYDAREKRTLLLAVTRDVTERKEADTILREREKQLAESQRIARIGSWQHNLTTNEVVWSDELFRVLGLDPEKDQADFDMFFSMIHPDDQPMLKKEIEETLETGKHFSVDYRFRMRDGRTRILHAQAELMTDEAGTKCILSGTGQDITERKEAEEALRKSEERYHGLFDSARDAIMIADVESGIIVNANKAAEKLLGRPASEIIGMHQSEIHPEKDKELYISAFRKAVKNERATFPKPGGDMYLVDKKGRKIPVEISANVIELEGKRLIQGIFRDITERRAAERAAREGKQYLENVLNSIQDGICILDLDYTVVRVNPTIEKWYAHRAPIVGKKCHEVFKNRTDACDRCPCASVIIKGESCTETISYLGPDGPSGTIELHAFPLLDPETGKTKGIIKYFRDITDKVALQAEAFRAAQLASVGELAAGVAHEINNPINGIINYAQLLINRLPEGGEENSISRRIIKEGDRISGIVSALLAFTREDTLMEEPVDIVDLVLEALSLTIAQMAKEGIDVRINIPDDMPRVNVKRQHLEQVFLNLINNARHALNTKYPEKDPEKAIEISGESMVAEDIPHIRISFTDWGTGIAPDIIDRVTEPFFTTKQKGSGTGLGLSISSSIIKNNGGTLSIDSVEGEYTKVMIELPIGGA